MTDLFLSLHPLCLGLRPLVPHHRCRQVGDEPGGGGGVNGVGEGDFGERGIVNEQD
jgi:hypothetical protein